MITTSETINELAAALSAAQGEMDGAKKDSKNPFFNSKYADLASVWGACREPLSKHGLSIVQFPTAAFSGDPEVSEVATRSGETRLIVKVATIVSVVTRLMHSSGQWMQDESSAMLPSGDPQSVGSAITYLRRYSLQSVAGIAPEDDDAEASMIRQTAGPREAARPAAAPRDGSPTCVTKVTDKPTTTGGLQFMVRFSDGESFSTFDQATGMLAKQLAETGEPVTYKTVKKGAYTNLLSLNRVKPANRLVDIDSVADIDDKDLPF